MSLSLHAALVPGWLQTLEAVRGLVDKAEQHCNDHRLAPADLIGARLHADMNPFSYQVKSCMTHSRLAVEGIRAGHGGPDLNEPPATFPGLAAMMDETILFIAALEPAEFDSLAGREFIFSFRNFRCTYRAEDFLRTFTQPNFFFHASTAYAILRMKGVAIGKRDYLGSGSPQRQPGFTVVED